MSLKAASYSETSADFQKATRHHILEYSDLQEYSSVFLTAGLTLTTRRKLPPWPTSKYSSEFTARRVTRSFALSHAFCQHYL
jgi:hypothetical protein